MSPSLKLTGLAAMFALNNAAQAAEWQARPAEGDRGAVLTYGAGEPVSYRFECAGDSVIVTETGVTQLLDLQTGQPVDDKQATLPAGAAAMALFSGKGDPQMVPAEAARNPAGGWDLTIRLRKADRQLKAIGKSEMISLFTTGYTIAVPLDAADRARWKAFMEACQAAP
jgi:hypothetical protein